MTRYALIIACWIAVAGCGAFLRFERLSDRPFHADEATGARITASRMKSGDYRFDPSHYHGPTLSSLAIPILKANGEDGWGDMTKATPRVLTAIAGSLLVLTPLLWRRRFGDGPMLLSAALLATSPLLVYYSRMFIHEPLLALFGMIALVSITHAPRYGIPGLLIGLMFATKESFAISMVAWSVAGFLVAMENRENQNAAVWMSRLKACRARIAVSLAVFILVSVLFYTDGLRQPRGAVDAVRTFFVYETVGGHEKPPGYYFNLLVLPFRSGYVWWFGTPVAVLAAIAFIGSFRPAAREPAVVRFLGYAAIGHFAIYSLIAYKTPWLACLPWAHVCLLAGFAIVDSIGNRRWHRGVICLLAGVAVVSQYEQSRRAIGRFASDDRNPFAYVPTSGDIETLAPWLERLAKVAPGETLEPLAVIGEDYWPLPWYLRPFGKIGYWQEPPAELASMPVVFAMPDAEENVAKLLEKSHTPMPRGLRAGVPVTLFVRNDIWTKWMETGK